MVTSGTPAVTRDDASPWATLPRRTGGLFWNAAAPEMIDAVAAMKGCAPSATAATATLESTLDEVVDVGRVELAPARDAKAEACVREELWKVSLPGATFSSEFEAFTVDARL